MADSDGGGLEEGLLADTSSPQHSLPQLLRSATSQLSDVGANEGLRVRVECKHLSYFVGPQQQTRILNNVSVAFETGVLTAIMGPSGAGKTTLISCLLGNAAGRVQGAVTVNDVPGPPRIFKSISKLIPQEDILLQSFTVRETLYYQSQLVLPERMSDDVKAKRVENVVESLNLTSCLDVKIGGPEDRGVSGGQRKRVSIAMDLLSNPAVLFVDEPTSGLDSKSAEDVVTILKDLAHGNLGSSERTIITTIHQPSFRIFSLFDKVLLLTQGAVAWHGNQNDLEQFFQQQGLGCPEKENPADHYMRLLQDPGAAQQLCDAFASKTPSTDETQETSDTAHRETLRRRSSSDAGTLRSKWWCCLQHNALENTTLEDVEMYPTSAGKQFRVLLRRSLYDTIKDKNKLLRSFTLKIVVGVMVGLVWWQAANHPKLTKITGFEGALFIILMTSTMETLSSTLITFPTSRALMIREYTNGGYALSSFYPALMVSIGVTSMIYAFTMTVPVYLMVGFQEQPIKVLRFLITIALMSLIGSAAGVIVGATSRDILEAQNKLMPILAPLIMFSGYILPYSDMNVVWRTFYHLSFFQYGLSAMQLNVLEGETFHLNIMDKVDVEVSGEFLLKEMFNLDPSTHFVDHYLGILALYCVVITFVGYFIVRSDLRRKRG